MADKPLLGATQAWKRVLLDVGLDQVPPTNANEKMGVVTAEAKHLRVLSDRGLAEDGDVLVTERQRKTYGSCRYRRLEISQQGHLKVTRPCKPP